MRQRIYALPAAALLLVAASAPLNAQKLHTNDRWEECAFVIDASLTKAAWHQFASEVGLVAYMRPLAAARPLGARRIEFALLQNSTMIDDADAAWNDTFSHPDSTHWLFDGNALPVPGLALRVGVTDRVDAGAYFTKNVRSNYGIAGAQVQYNLVNDHARRFAASGRATAAVLFGPDDLSASVYGLDFVVSRDISILAPYAGVSGYLSRAQEHTSAVDFDDENILGVQGMVGVEARVRALRLGVEYNLARVSGYSFKIGLGL